MGGRRTKLGLAFAGWRGSARPLWLRVTLSIDADSCCRDLCSPSPASLPIGIRPGPPASARGAAKPAGPGPCSGYQPDADAGRGGEAADARSGLAWYGAGYGGRPASRPCPGKPPGLLARA